MASRIATRDRAVDVGSAFDLRGGRRVDCARLQRRPLLLVSAGGAGAAFSARHPDRRAHGMQPRRRRFDQYAHHADSATELRALEGTCNDPRLDPAVVAKILCDNPRSLYSL